MKPEIIFTALMFITIVLSVRSRPVYDSESDIQTLRNYFVESPSYSDLLALLVNSKTLLDKQKEHHHHHTTRYRTKQATTDKHHLVPLPTRPIGRRTRLSSSYGRKSHWDTFFG
ncbi:unnamed protein product [Adineta ricciae]|uniref:Uncharacterized protein n=1 Tax=Adineta ricciae TaxID=249248 RepID=A0A813WY99_ADIRI|nr:unnamed protein product [Adineta ricciae]CAF0861653.1 unnamed protein product [Adineta ricciae]